MVSESLHDLWASSTLFGKVTFFFFTLDEFPPKIHMETNGPTL